MKRALTAWPALTAALACGLSCAPDLGGSDSLLTSVRLLAVRAEPAEAKPGAAVTVTALVAGPEGTVTAPVIDWGFCDAPLPLTEDNVVSGACLDPATLVAAGRGGSVATHTPATGCSLFGPDTPPGGFRPRAPDSTGGYYQPLAASLAGAGLAFDLLRIQCDLADAPASAVAAFRSAYHVNLNPDLLPLVATIDGAAAPLTAIPASARVLLQASWSAADAETYAYFDPVSQAVTTKREAMTVAWYSSAGALDSESTGRAEDDPSTTTGDGWVAPSAPGAVHLWVVLRDSRGGADFSSLDVLVVR